MIFEIQNVSVCARARGEGVEARGCVCVGHGVCVWGAAPEAPEAPEGVCAPWGGVRATLRQRNYVG